MELPPLPGLGGSMSSGESGRDLGGSTEESGRDLGGSTGESGWDLGWSTGESWWDLGGCISCGESRRDLDGSPESELDLLLAGDALPRTGGGFPPVFAGLDLPAPEAVDPGLDESFSSRLLQTLALEFDGVSDLVLAFSLLIPSICAGCTLVLVFPLLIPSICAGCSSGEPSRGVALLSFSGVLGLDL